MPALNFPNAPTDGQIYTANGANYVWNQAKESWNNVTDADLIEATASDIFVGSETDRYVSPAAFRDATAPVVLTDAATIAVDMNLGRNFVVTLGDNRTLGNPTNVQAGDSGTIYVVQDGVGSRTLSLGSNWKVIGEAPILSTDATSVDVLTYFARSATEITLSYVGSELLPEPTAYANIGGSGDRTSSIALTSNVFATTYTAIVDGSYADSAYFGVGIGNGSGHITFDLGSGKTGIIDAFKMFQSTSSTHGIWQFEGSNDASNYDVLLANITLGSAEEKEHPFSNSTPYRYYRLRHMSGERTQVPYIREFEFKIRGLT